MNAAAIEDQGGPSWEGIRPRQLYLMSCISLVVTAMSFAIRGDIMGDLEIDFLLNKTNVGWIAGAAFWGFGLSILFGGPLCDVLGMRNLMFVAAAGHIGGVFLTVFAPNFQVLFAATLIIGIGNGLVEAVINPLTATIYPKEKTRKLVALHAWFPGGIVLGGVLCYGLRFITDHTDMHLGWKIKMSLMLLPAVAYAIMLITLKFPKTERVAAGVSFGDMVKELFNPLFLVVWACMWLTAATELGPGQWVANIFNDMMKGWSGAGILVLVWINGLMYLLRQFGGGLAHRISPVRLIATSAIVAAAGLWLFSIATSPVMWFVAAGLLAAGTAFWWPSMLGITSERFPRGGALLLAVIGATGSFSTAVAGPVMGYINDTYGPDKVLPIWALLPVAILVVFTLVALHDRARGGYKALDIGKTE